MIFNSVIGKKGYEGVLPKEVNFYDYDGTLVHSYTVAEAQALTVLPSAPIHDGLIFQGWNWSLEKIKALTRPMNIGAMYITDDGKTRLKIRIWDKARSNVPLYITQTVANGVTIDWGDGSNLETLDGTGEVTTLHQYANVGNYTILLSVSSECILGLGWPSTIDISDSCVMGPSENGGFAYRNSLQEVSIGDNVIDIGPYAFAECYSLMAITIPNSVRHIMSYAFIRCYSLNSITVPNSVTKISYYLFGYNYSLANVSISDGLHIIEGYAFSSCSSLETMFIPDSVTSIEAGAFRFCHSLASINIPDLVSDIKLDMLRECSSLSSITIPGSVTSLGSKAFENCSSMAEYHLKPVMPPALTDITAFDGILSDCIIYVPTGSLEAYKTAENWSAYSSHMREE